MKTAFDGDWVVLCQTLYQSITEDWLAENERANEKNSPKTCE